MQNQEMTSGIGQFHTNEPDPNNPDKKLTPYLAIKLSEVLAMIDKPQQVDKPRAQWLIPSTHPSRNFKEQEQHGSYLMLWADLDKNPPTLPDVAVILDGFLGGCDFELYNSRSATAENQKARLLVSLPNQLNFAEWRLAQEILNDKLEALDIIPDRANERAAQLCYLPNKGAFYGSESRRDGKRFNPLTQWGSEISAKREALEAERSALEARQKASIARREALSLSDAPDLIGAFNLAYTPQDWLIKAGYSQRGNTFRHPNSETGNFTASVRPNDNGILRVHTLSPADPLYTGCGAGGAHDAFSTFCTLFHGGDRNAALKDAGDNLLSIDVVSYNKAKQAEWAKQNNVKPGANSANSANYANDNIDYSTMPPPANFEPEPLRAPTPKAEPYPVEALGDVLGAAAIALHETIKAPLTLCCQSVLASASLAAQSHFDVLLPWGEKKPLSLYLLTVAESGERKSGVDDVVLSAAKALERQDMECFKDEQEQYEADIARWKEVSQEANKNVAKAKNQESADQAAAAMAGITKPETPIMPLRFVTEPTVEGLYKLMAAGQPSLGLFSDEGGLLIGGHALNSDNALRTMARWCKLWDGAAFDRVRGGDGSGVLYGRRLAMHQLAQPDVMTLLLGDRMANGQGLLARCLTAWPESTIGNRHIEVFEQPRERAEVKKLFAKLKALTEAEPRTAKSGQELDPVGLPLSEDAKQLAIGALNQFETLMQAGDDLSELRDRASKAVENSCRIAGVMTAIEEGTAARVIDDKRLGRALVIVQWYLSEALRIRGAAAIPQAVSDAESLSRWLAGRGYKVFRTAPVLTKGPSHLRNKQRLNAAIKELVDNGYIEQNDPGKIVDGVSTRKSWSVIYVV